MADGRKISDLDNTSLVTANDLMEISKEIEEEYLLTIKSVTVGEMSNAIELLSRLDYFTNSNTEPIGFYNGDIFRPAVQVSFTPVKDTQVNSWAEILLDTQFIEHSPEIKIYVAYVFDNMEMTRHPIQTWDIDGRHVLNLGFSTGPDELVAGETQHSLAIYLRAEGGNCFITPGDAIVTCQTIGKRLEE